MAEKLPYHHILGFVEDKDMEVQMREALKSKPHVRVINFYSRILEDLLLAAKYRTVSRPTVIVLHSDKVVARLCRIPDAAMLAHLEPAIG